jgi:hypothetical protein
MGIARYQTVVLPNLRDVVTAWDEYRRTNAIEWSDMWMSKADISNCFNQLHWHPKTAKLMGFMLTHDNAHLRVRSSRDTHDMGRYR